MNHPHHFRRISTATSALFALTAIALSVLWARSYSVTHTLLKIDGNCTFAQSTSGYLTYSYCDQSRYAGGIPTGGWRFGSLRTNQASVIPPLRLSRDHIRIAVPYWAALCMATTTSAIALVPALFLRSASVTC
jgi:hypothetical protein